MAKLTCMNSISLKKCADVNEAMIQEFISNNPEVLGLGELSLITREKVQPAGGRLDILLTDNETRYEVEIQLGATDPSHIIRTIEYWDSERKRYPQYDHCAVIVAEEITNRFMNVISLFNGAIPLIALQVKAYRVGDDIQLAFTRVIDRVTLETDEDEVSEVTDRAFWENHSTKQMLAEVDKISSVLIEKCPGYELKYNKHYIGFVKDGMAKNFVIFKPKKKWLYICVKSLPDLSWKEKAENVGLEISEDNRWKRTQIRLDSFKNFVDNKDLLMEIIDEAIEYMGVE